VIVVTLGSASFLFYNRNLNAKGWEMVNLAEQLMEAKDYENAVKTLLPLAGKGTRFEGADRVLYDLARAYQGTGSAEAEQLWDRLAADFPKSEYYPEAQMHRVRRILAIKPQEARPILDDLIKNATGEVRAQAQLGMAQILEKEQKQDEVRAMYYDILSQDPPWNIESQVKDRLTEINNATLWSPVMDEFSQLHTVEKGEAPVVVGQKYRTTAWYVLEANNLAKTLHPGQKVKVPKEPFAVRVNKKRCRLELVTESGRFIKWYLCGVGKISEKTPAGEYTIINKEVNPKWYKPGGGVVKPGDPENALGVRWMGIGGSLGIHGTNEPDTIGKPESAGCIRMHNHDVEELYKLITYQTKVTIIEGK
jgi:hypothetical protein